MANFTSHRGSNFTDGQYELSGLGGLDPSGVQSSYQQGIWNRPVGQFDQSTGYQATPDKYGQTYNAPQGGTWSRSGSSMGGANPTFGSWNDGSGRSVSDLSGYLGMRGQQNQLADTGDYKKRLDALISNPDNIQENAGYKFRVGQGEQAINRSAAAKGMLGSGNVLAALTKYGQDMGSQEYDNQVNTLGSLLTNAQNFGLQSGYYSQDPTKSPFGLKYTSPV